jgi:hypothetical protein
VSGDTQVHWLAFDDGLCCTTDLCAVDGKSYMVDAARASPNRYPEIGWAPEARPETGRAHHCEHEHP